MRASSACEVRSIYQGLVAHPVSKVGAGGRKKKPTPDRKKKAYAGCASRLPVGWCALRLKAFKKVFQRLRITMLLGILRDIVQRQLQSQEPIEARRGQVSVGGEKL